MEGTDVFKSSSFMDTSTQGSGNGSWGFVNFKASDCVPVSYENCSASLSDLVCVSY
jgi:hypothetical protein